MKLWDSVYTQNTHLVLGDSYWSIIRISRTHKFHSKKIQFVLSDDNSDRRLQLCEEMSQDVIKDPNLLINIYFSNERSFIGIELNMHNFHY